MMKRTGYSNIMDVRQYEKILRQVPLFSGLNAMDIERVSRLVIRHKIPKGKTIINEGQELEGFYIIISGQVKIYKLSPNGKEHILHIANPGDTFAEVAAFSGASSPANATAITNSEIFFIFTEDLLRLIKDNPQLSLNMLASMSKYLRLMVSTIEELALKEVPARLAKYLLDLMSAAGTRDLSLPITKRELAARLGTISETLSRALNKLRSKRIIRVAGNKIVVLNKAGLEEISSGTKL